MTLHKPSKLGRTIAQWAKRTERAQARRARERTADAEWRILSLRVEARDRGLCRVCGCKTTKAGVGHPSLWRQVHHIVYRSAGGTDDLSNLIDVCGLCHEAEHQHRISITGTADDLHVEHIEVLR